jgi:hypothetical protein
MSNEKTPKGMLVHVYRSDIQATQGPSKTHDTMLLIGIGIPELFTAGDMPIVKLVRRSIGGNEYLHAEPIEPCPSHRRGYMAGGNFIYTSDSRFPNRYPIAVHDRTEG